MTKLFRNLHRGQAGIGFIAIAIIAAVMAGTWFGGNWFFQNTSIGQSFVGLFRPAEEQPADSTAPEDVIQAYRETWSCWTNDISSDLNSYRYVVWNCTETGQIEGFGYRIGRSAAGTRYTEARVYIWDAVNTRLGDFVGASSAIPYSALGYRSYPSGLQPPAFYDFDETAVILYANVTYAIGIASAGGSGDLWFNLDKYGVCCDNILGCYWQTSDTWRPDYNYGHSITEMVLRSPTVTTEGHTLLPDGTIRLEGSAEVVGTMDCGFYYGTNETLVTQGNTTRVIAGTSRADDVRFGFTYELNQLEDSTTYYYRAFSEIVNLEFAGAVLNFTRYDWQVPVSVGCYLIQNNANGIVFETNLLGTNETISYNVTLDYGQTYDDMLDQVGSATVVTNTSQDGYWRNSFSVNQTFDTGSQYWYRATVTGNDSSIAYSVADSFVPWDPDRPSIVNYLIEWTGLDVDETWWLVAIVAVALAAVLSVVFRQKWIIVIAAALAFVALVAYGVVPTWVVILAILIAGWIIFKMVYRRAGATGD